MVRNLGDDTRVLSIEISRASKETYKCKGIPTNLLGCRERVGIRKGHKNTSNILCVYSTKGASGLKPIKGEFYIDSIGV